MGWFKDAVNSVVDAVEDVVTTVTDVVADVVETIGSTIQNGINAIGNAVANVPYIGKPLRGGLRWLGGITSGIFNVGAAMIKASLGILGATITGGIQILGGILSLDWELIKKGGLSIGAGLLGGLIYTTASSISLFQKVLFLQNFERNLTKEEHSRLKKIFHDSISLYNIRIVEGRSGIYDINNYPFTLGNTIYLKDTNLINEFETLIHESIHVWQYQNYGSRYTAEAIVAQSYYSGNSAYNWVLELDQRGKSSWEEFNREAQAAFMEDVWKKGGLIISGIGQGGNGIFFELEEKRQSLGSSNVVPEFMLSNGKIYTDFAITSIKDLRKHNYRLSNRI
jgi:hypothetical protein